MAGHDAGPGDVCESQPVLRGREDLHLLHGFAGVQQCARSSVQRCVVRLPVRRRLLMTSAASVPASD